MPGHRPPASTAVADALDEFNRSNGGLACGGILDGVVAYTEDPVCGPAFTARLCPPGESERPFNEFLDEVPEGSIVVVDNGGRRGRSVFGGLMAAEARRRGALAAVVNGDVRDVVDARRIGFGMYARGRTPASGRTVFRLASTQEPVRWDDVTISPGDVVVADGDGAVVIPGQLAAAVLERAQAIDDQDSVLTADVISGVPLAQARARRSAL